MIAEYPFPCYNWKQSSDPFKRSSVTGYQGLNNTFRFKFSQGLGKKSSQHSISTIIGSRPYQAVWYNPIGARVLTSDGKIMGPECGNSAPQTCGDVSLIELYVKKAPHSTASSGRKKREAFSVIETKNKISKREAEVETEEELSMRSYGSRLRYECGLARKFWDVEAELHYDERWMQCNWNTSWTLTDTLDECVWVACLDPPQPPEGTDLQLNWDGDQVEFGGNVSYVCDSGKFFEWDRDMPEYNVTCLEGGTWDEPKEWPICLQCKIAFKIVQYIISFQLLPAVM